MDLKVCYVLLRMRMQLVMPAICERLAGRLSEEWWHLSEVLMAPAAMAAQSNATLVPGTLCRDL